MAKRRTEKQKARRIKTRDVMCKRTTIEVAPGKRRLGPQAVLGRNGAGAHVTKRTRAVAKRKAIAEHGGA